MTKVLYVTIGIVAGATISISYAQFGKVPMACDAYTNSCAPVPPTLHVDTNGNVFAVCVNVK